MRRLLPLSFLIALVVVPSVVSAISHDSHGTIRNSAWSTGGVMYNQPNQDNYGGKDTSPSFIAAYASTSMVSYNFNSSSGCTNKENWNSVDLTAQVAEYWHCDDFTGSPWGGTNSTGGVTFSPIQGSRSMWMAAVPPAGYYECTYANLPGYGNNWDQIFSTKGCTTTGGGPTSSLDVAFKIKFDTESEHDATTFEYSLDCTGATGWQVLEGPWSGAGEVTVAKSYAVGPGPVRLRFHFTSDNSWSNQDGLYNGFGVAVDSLKEETLVTEGFETTALGSFVATDWIGLSPTTFSTYGDYWALFKKAGANYEDQCLDNLGCYWAAINGSTEFYSCGRPPQPSQRSVPQANAGGMYIANEIWSPLISYASFAGGGSDFRLRYSVYRDLPFDNMVFTTWHVRSFQNTNCPGPWKDKGFAYYGDSKDWGIVENTIGALLDLTAVGMQVAIGVVDMCPLWCGVYGTFAGCHSPAPYIDQVKVIRINSSGPQWVVRDAETFNDTFSTDGTITGTARADIALDILPLNDPQFVPGDSAVAYAIVDPKYVNGTGTDASGLLNDPVLSTYIGRDKTKKQAYAFVRVVPPQLAKTGAPLSEGPGGTANRYPFSGTAVIGGYTWTKIRMDYTYTSTSLGGGDGAPGPFQQPIIPGRFNVDLNDNLFTPGDTILYFFAATSPDGTTYFAPNFGTTGLVNVAADNAQEFTILPAGGYNRGGDILYVDGADGSGDQTVFDGTFMTLGIADKVDRFDVRAPSSGVSNRLGGRVQNIGNQLSACYKRILWDCGNLSITLGDGTHRREKDDDYAVLNYFLGNLSSSGGVYLCGDDVPCELAQDYGASAVSFRSTYMPFIVLDCDHRLGGFGISPAGIHWPGRIFSYDATLFGGCPELNDFDVIGASGTSRVEMSYVTATSANGVTVSNTNGNARVVMSGASFAYIVGGELPLLSSGSVATSSRSSDPPVRPQHMHDILVFLGSPLGPVTGSSRTLQNGLSQNYPNPFNPQTSIAFSIATRGHVTLKIYDVAGALVRTLANESMAAGAHAKTWDGRDDNGTQVSSGVYFYRLVANGFSRTKKMVLLK